MSELTEISVKRKTHNGDILGIRIGDQSRPICQRKLPSTFDYLNGGIDGGERVFRDGDTASETHVVVEEDPGGWQVITGFGLSLSLGLRVLWSTGGDLDRGVVAII